MNKKFLGLVALCIALAFSFYPSRQAFASSTYTGSIGTGAGSSPYNFATIGSKIYVTNTNGNTVSVIDTANSNATSSVTVGGQPGAIAALGTHIYVANNASSTVSDINTASGNSVTTIPVGTNPIALTVLGTKVYVANLNSSSVTTIDSANSDATSTVRVGSGPVALTALNSYVYSVNFNGNSVTAINTASGNSTTTIGVGGYPEAISVIGSKLYVANNYMDTMTVIDPGNNFATTTFSIPAIVTTNPLAVIGSKIYIPTDSSSIAVIDTGNGNATSTIFVANATGPSAIDSVTAVGSTLYLGDAYSGVIYTMDTTSSNATSTLGTTISGVNVNHSIDIGSAFYLANAASNSVAIIQKTTTAPTVSAPLSSHQYAQNSLPISIYIPQTPAPGSVHLTVVATSTGSTTFITLQNIGQGTSNFNVSLIGNIMNSSYVASASTTTIPAGTYAATLTYSDMDDDPAASASVSNVTVVAPPTVTLTSPTSGQTATSSVLLTATATSTAGITGVQFYVDNSPVGSQITSSPFTYTYNSSGLSSGSHTVSAVAEDTVGGYSTTTTSITVGGGGCGTQYTTVGSIIYATTCGVTTAIGTVPSSSIVTSTVSGSASGGSTAVSSVEPSVGVTSATATSTPAISQSATTPASSTTASGSTAGSVTSGCPAGYTCTPSVPAGTVYANLSGMTGGTSNLGNSTGGTMVFTKNLQLGMTDADVSRLQTLLDTHGFPVSTQGAGSLGHETTKFGSLTKSALARFQKSEGIASTGFFGPITRKLVESL